MALNANSYGTVAEVVALTRIYLKGQATYSTTTLPTQTEVEGFIDKVSGVLNLALAAGGFTTPVTQTDAAFACDAWVVGMAAAWVEASQPTAAFGQQTNPRAALLAKLSEKASTFVKENTVGFAVLGVAQTGDDSNALIFTGETVQTQRSDSTDTSLEQPKFRRGQFDA